MLKIKTYLLNNKLFLAFVILSLISTSLLRLFTLGDLFTIKPLLVDLSLILLVGSFGYLIKPNKQPLFYLFILIIYTITNVINSIYYTFYYSFATFALLSSLGQVGEVTGSILEKLKFSHFVYLFIPIIFFIIIKYLENKKTILAKSKNKMKYTLITGLIVFVFSITAISIKDLSGLAKQWNREMIVSRFGIILYQTNDLVQSLTPKINQLFGYDQAAKEFRDYYSNKDYTKTNNLYTNIFNGKNVVFVHMESIQTFLLDLKFNGQEVTPNLNKLKEESLYFNHFYPQVGVGTSSDTEFTLQASLMPALSGTVFVSYTDTYYETINKLLKDKGYYTFSMHANKASMWNRAIAHKSLGYDTFYSKEYYTVPEDINDPNYIGLGLSDKEFFRQSETILEDIELTNKNYIGTIITLTNHSPWAEKDKFDSLDLIIYNDNKEDRYLEDSKMGSYLKSSHYSDEALGEFINYVKSSNYYNNTIFIFYGDHDARFSKAEFDKLYNYDVETGTLLTSDDPNYYDYDYYLQQLNKNTPLLIWTKDQTYTGEVNYYMGMIDIVPTLANMMGFTCKYCLGNDIFTIKDDNIVVFPNGNFLTNKVYYNNTKGEYKVLSDVIIDEDYITKNKKYTENILNLSNNIIVHDLIRKEVTNLNKVMEEK